MWFATTTDAVAIAFLARVTTLGLFAIALVGTLGLKLNDFFFFGRPYLAFGWFGCTIDDDAFFF